MHVSMHVLVIYVSINACIWILCACI